MKKISILLVFLSFAFVASAKEVSYDEALQTASEFFAPASSSKKQIKALKQNLSLSTTFKQTQESNKPAFYIFNNGENGFVIVSADDNAKQILGYSNHGAFDAKNIPSNVQFWLNRYAEEITHIAKNKITKPLYANNVTYNPIDPLLENIEWNQGTPYNNLCPLIGSERCVTGCVATAAAQIMRSHKYPEKGKGSVDYKTKTYSIPLQYDLSQSTYDWGNMLEQYTSSATGAQKNAVATLLRDVGYACYMDYGIGGTSDGGSGTSDVNAGYALVNNFGYDKSLKRIVFNALYNHENKIGVCYWYAKEDVMDEIYAELQESRPMMICGSSAAGSGGHAFVCDGIQEDGKLHINWGWGGQDNGNFELTAFKPSTGGIGDGNKEYIQNISVLTNIKPDEGSTESPLTIGLHDQTFTKSNQTNLNQFKKTDNVPFKATKTNDKMVEFAGYDIFNLGCTDIKNLQIGYSISKNNTTIKTLVSDWKLDNYTLEKGSAIGINQDIITTVSIKDLVKDVPVGVYDLQMVVKEEGKPTSYPVYVWNRGKVKNHIAIGKDNIYIYPAGTTKYKRSNTPTNLKKTQNGDKYKLSWEGDAVFFVLLTWNETDLTVETVIDNSTDITSDKNWAVFACDYDHGETVDYISAISDIAYYDGNNPTPTTDEDEEEFRDYLEIPTTPPATIEDYKDGLPKNDDFKITEQETTLCTWNKETSWTVNNENILGLGLDLGKDLAATRCFIHYNDKWEYADKADFISEWKQNNTSVTFNNPPTDITESNSKIYCVFVSYIKKSNINLVKNGNFEHTYTGDPAKDAQYPFQSDYTWGNTYPGGFMISTAVGKTDGSGSTICDDEGDHTKGKGGNGLYFIANGPNDGGDLLWQQELDINGLQGRYFAFSCWGQCWCDNRRWTNPAKIQWKVDGNNLGDKQKIDYKYCEWKQISAIWERIEKETITLSLHNEEDKDNGNDFGLDDIFFGPCEVRVDIVEVTLGQRVDKPTEGTLSLCSILEVQQNAESIKEHIKKLYPESKGYIFDDTQINDNTDLADFEVIIKKEITCSDGTKARFDWKKLRVSYETNPEKEWKSNRPKPYDDTSITP